MKEDERQENQEILISFASNEKQDDQEEAEGLQNQRIAKQKQTTKNKVSLAFL